MGTQRILIDTSIAVEGGEAIIAKLEKIAPVFVTDIVLQELDGHKNNTNGAVAFQAREFFRRLGNSNGIALDVLPLDGMKLEKTDTLRKMFLGATPLHVIVRKPYKSRDINDSKIIEIAKDYNMVLVTLDTAQRVRGLSDGVEAVTLASILPIESFKEGLKMENEMSEVEKLMKKIEVQNNNKADSNVGTFLGFILFGILCLFVANNALGILGLIFGVILFFIFIAFFAKPMSKKEFEDFQRKKPILSESLTSSESSATVSPLDLNLRSDIVR